MTIPRLHLVTDDAVLARADFGRVATALVETHGAALALQLRGHATDAATLAGYARSMTPAAARAGALLLVNDRVDVALAAGCGVQLGRRSIPVADARRLLGPDAVVGYSAHAADEAAAAARDGASFVLMGTVWATASHPGRDGAGPALVTAAADALARSAGGRTVPIIAIGGVTPERTRDALDAGAHGVAVLRGVWASDNPAAAVAGYMDELRAVRS